MLLLCPSLPCPANTLRSHAGDYFPSFVRIEPEKIAIVFVVLLGALTNDDLFASHVVDFHLPLSVHSGWFVVPASLTFAQ